MAKRPLSNKIHLSPPLIGVSLEPEVLVIAKSHTIELWEKESWMEPASQSGKMHGVPGMSRIYSSTPGSL